MVIRKVSSKGHIVLGKQYAGRRVSVDEMEPGVWIVKVGKLIPDNERWLHTPEVQAKLGRAIARAEEEPLWETDLEELERKLLGSESSPK